ncbi:hypothetical protein F9817_13905 [Vibrio sp. CAIM 722]|uniref:Uncharacterized protein n=1 Tax=Vibrio eleionomae TaxID=2653505 RepID=A0A7X4LMC8_9VIBR|nr:hypothetical protein [Vibrio eleionomae]MZI94287.1 hypothetical protein [Vibrio eleionomae]
MEILKNLPRFILLGIPPKYFFTQLCIAFSISIATGLIAFGTYAVVNCFLYPYSVYFYQLKTNSFYPRNSIAHRVFTLWLCLSFAIIIGLICIVNQLSKFDLASRNKEF